MAMNALSGGSRGRQKDGPEPGWASPAEEHSASEPLSKELLLVPELQPSRGTLSSAGFPPWISNRGWPWQGSAAVLQGCATSQKKTKVDRASPQSPLPAHIPQATASFFPQRQLRCWTLGSKFGGQSIRLAQGALQTQRDIQLCQSALTSLEEINHLLSTWRSRRKKMYSERLMRCFR